MPENPKIVFEGKDNITPAANSANQSLKELSKTLLEKSLLESTTSRGVITNFKEEINLLKQKNQLELENRREGIKEHHERKLQEIKSDKKEAEDLIKNVKAPVEERKIAAQELKTGVYERAEIEADLDYKKELKAIEEKENKKQTKYLEEVVKRLTDIIRLSQSKNEDDKKLSEKQLKNLDIEGPGEKIEERIQQEQKDKEEEKDKSGKGLFAGAFLGNIAGQIALSGLGKIKEIGSTVISGQEGDKMAADILRVLPGIGGASSAMAGRWMEAEMAKQTALSKYQAISGGKGYIGGQEFGYGFEESSQINQTLLRSRGSLDNLNKEIQGTYRLIKGTGIDLSTISQSSSTYRYQDVQRTAEQNASVLIQAIKNRGLINVIGGTAGNSRIEELFSIQNKLVEDQGQRLEKVSPETISTVIAAFQSVGGSFSDKRAGERISNINQALINPQNEYQQAMSYAALVSLKPGASLLDIMKMQEKGVGQEGYMKQMMGIMEQQYGSGELFTLALKNIFGLSVEQAETLTQGWINNREVFTGIGKMGLQPKEISEYYISEREKKVAKLEKAWSEGIEEGVREAKEQAWEGLEKIGEATYDILKEIKDYIVNKIFD